MPAKHAKPKIVTNIATGSPWRKKKCLQMPTKDRQKRQAEMAQTWQADIHDKKLQKSPYDKRQKNIFCTKMFAQKILGVPLLQCFSQVIDLEQRLFHAGLLLFKMAQFHFTHSKKF